VEITTSRPRRSCFQRIEAIRKTKFKASNGNGWGQINLSQTKVWADNDWSWTIGAVPWDLAHQEYQVECTLVWGAGQNQRASQRRKFKLFFDKYGHDEDLSTTRSITGYSPPNWFDARPNHWGSVVPRLSETWYGGYLWGSYSLNAGLFVYWRFNNIVSGNLPPGSVLISNAAAESAGATASYVYAPVAEGIDACAATVQHEFRHKWQMEQSWGVSNWSDFAALDIKIGPNGAWVRDGAVFDKDQDFIKDEWEEIPKELGGWGQIHNVPDAHVLNKQYDGNAFETDEEFDADMHGGRTHVLGSLGRTLSGDTCESICNRTLRRTTTSVPQARRYHSRNYGAGSRRRKIRCAAGGDGDQPASAGRDEPPKRPTHGDHFVGLHRRAHSGQR
jgi:hypothetical protein